MRRQTQTDHSECSNRNLWIWRTVAPVHIEKESTNVNLVTQAVWSGSNWAVHVPREKTRITRANGDD